MNRWVVGTNFAESASRPFIVHDENGSPLLSATGRTRRWANEVAAHKEALAQNLTEIHAGVRKERQDHWTRQEKMQSGQSYQQAELNMLEGEQGCAVQVWNNDDSQKTKRIHFYGPEATALVRSALGAISDDTAKRELQDLEAWIRVAKMGGPLVNQLNGTTNALRNALALLGMSELSEGL